jgi:glycosyltransferase involved in cell wall biosynthesis
MPEVSILMPCYNAAETLPETLESLACQTLTDFEIIAVDDGSNDSTLHILQDWAAHDSRLHVLTKKHSGIVDTLNLGLRACQADYVARMDADDRCHPERLALQTAFLKENPDIGLVSCQVAGFPKEHVREGFRLYLEWLNALISDADIRCEIFVESPLPHPSVTFRKAAVLAAGNYQEHGWPEDYDLWLRMYLQGTRFAKIPQVLLDWREHPERLTRTDGRYSLENFLRTKAYYLTQGPLVNRDAVIIWGAGMMGRRLSKQLSRLKAPIVAFVDIDPKKIGRTRRGLPIISPEELIPWWRRYENPIILAAVGARGARILIRQRLNEYGFVEAQDWWGAA